MPDPEIERLRDRMHKVEGSQHALHERQRIGDRERRKLGERLDDMQASVEQLVNEDRIAAAVAERLKGKATEGFTRLQVWGIRAAIVGVILSPVVIVLQAFGVLR